MYKPHIISIAESNPLGKLVLDYLWKRNQTWFLYGMVVGLSIGAITGYFIRGQQQQRRH